MNKIVFQINTKLLTAIICLTSMHIIAKENAESNNAYMGDYQSYYHTDDNSSSTLDLNKQNNGEIKSSKIDDCVNASIKQTSNSTVTHKKPNDNSTGAENKNCDDKIEVISTLRLRKEDPPAHWNNIGRNMEAGALHGNLSTQIEIEDYRWSNNDKNNGKFKLATTQAFLRHDELPNWYFGFWNAREDSYRGKFSNQEYTGTNTINELFLGHIFETWHGNFGLEVMAGSESAKKRWKNRIKVWQDFRLTDKWSLAGYAYGEFQPRSNQQGNGDLEQYIFEIEPAIQYRVNPDLGLYLRPYYYHDRQKRANWGDIIEGEWKVTAGLWRNWYPLLTSLYVGLGQDKIDNSTNANEIFLNSHYKFVGSTISYPIFDEVRLYGEFKAKFSEEYGLWTNTGHSWSPFTVVGISYNF